MKNIDNPPPPLNTNPIRKEIVETYEPIIEDILKSLNLKEPDKISCDFIEYGGDYYFKFTSNGNGKFVTAVVNIDSGVNIQQITEKKYELDFFDFLQNTKEKIIKDNSGVFEVFLNKEKVDLYFSKLDEKKNNLRNNSGKKSELMFFSNIDLVIVKKVSSCCATTHFIQLYSNKAIKAIIYLNDNQVSKYFEKFQKLESNEIIAFLKATVLSINGDAGKSASVEICPIRAEHFLKNLPS